MTTMPGVQKRWFQRDAYRYGMLMFILVLFGNAVWQFAHSPAGSHGDDLNLITTGMLLVNHLAMSFLPPARQKAVRVPQFLFIGLGLIYVFGLMFRVGAR